MREYFRPNLWPNTPDSLTEHLQHGGRPAFMARLALAATLGANYGIYGPAFELMEHESREPGSEEYLDSEKYQLRPRDFAGALERGESLGPFISKLNEIRRLHPALGAAERRPHPHAERRVYPIDQGGDSELFFVRAAFGIHHRVAVEAGRDLLVAGGIR